MTKIRTGLTTLVVIPLFLCSTGRGDVALDNGFVRLIFDETSFALKTLEEGETVFYFDPDESYLWAVTFLDTLAQPVEVGDLYYRSPETLQGTQSYTQSDSLGGKKLTLRWENIDLAGQGNLAVYITVFLPPASSESSWNILLQLSSTRFSLFSLDFPYLSVLPDYSGGELDALAYPSHAGALFTHPADSAFIHLSLGGDIDPEASGFKQTYPGGVAMQYAHLYDSNAKQGLFFTTYDTAGYLKRGNIKGQGTSIEYFIRQYPENNHFAGQDYGQPYDIMMKPIEGDWIDVAKFYRDFISDAPWMAQGRLSQRPDHREETAQTDITFFLLWWDFGGDPETALSYVQEYQEFFGHSTDIAVHLRNWGWPRLLIEGTIPSGVPEFLQACADSGIRTMPYTSTKDWPDQLLSDPRAHEGVARTINGEPYHSSQFHSYAMDPASEIWSTLYQEKVNEILQVLGATDIYLDNYPIARLCYQEEHGHPLGGGTYWIDGYKNMFTDIRASNSDAAMTNESRCELLLPWLDFFPAIYWETGQGDGPFVPFPAKPIPLVAASYHGYVGFGGSASHSWDEYNPTQFAFQQAYAFVNGNRLTLRAEPQHVSEFSPAKLAGWKYVRQLAQFLSVTMDYVYYGDWERPPAISGFPVVTVQFPETYPELYRRLSTPAVLAGAFTSEDGKLGLPFTNFTDDPASGSFPLQLSDYGLSPGFYRVYEVDSLGAMTLIDSITGGSYQRDLNLEAKSTTFFIISDRVECVKGDVNSDGLVAGDDLLTIA
ncbi:MAG: DUF6259 domain-containing protein, partial [bacterium]